MGSTAMRLNSGIGSPATTVPVEPAAETGTSSWLAMVVSFSSVARLLFAR
jgi:hypothetical protein